jgi:hypothetical protein
VIITQNVIIFFGRKTVDINRQSSAAALLPDSFSQCKYWWQQSQNKTRTDINGIRPTATKEMVEALVVFPDDLNSFSRQVSRLRLAHKYNVW